MTELDLIDAMADRLQKIFEGMTLKGKGDVQRPIRIYKQYMPLNSGLTKRLSGYSDRDYETMLPCIVVKYIEHTDREERRADQSMTNLKLLFGVYDEAQECQGYRDILNMIDLTRIDLLQERVLDNKFMMAVPLKTRLLEGETVPVYFGEMDLWYITGRPIMGRDFFTKEAIR